MCVIFDSKSLFGKLLAIDIFHNFEGLSQPFFALRNNEANFASQIYGAMQTLPRKFMEPSFFASQNYRAM